MSKRALDTQPAVRCLSLFSLLFACLVTGILFLGGWVSYAWADEADRPSVLLLDAGQGDYDTFSRFWLGDQDIEVVAEENGNRLITTSSPAWWGPSENSGNSAPPSFLFSKIDKGDVTTAEDIAWALDQIKAQGVQPKVFAVAMGNAGLPLREYAEDLSSVVQSSRADLVGMVFCGTAHNGYSIMETYPELSMWDTLANTAGLSREDLVPGSPYLEKLNAGFFPRPVKTLNVIGTTGDLGFGFTDGAAVSADYVLSSSLSSQIQALNVTSTLGTGINLTGQWSTFTDKMNRPDRLVDKNLVERLSAQEGYPTSAEVQDAVRSFYNEWFSDSSPVTHISNVIALDLSGSMFDDITPGIDKMGSAKNAAREYLKAIQAYSTLPQAAPVSVSIFGFSSELTDVSDGYDNDARNKIDKLEASHNETNVGIALEEALNRLESTPSASDKRLLLLSDGARTEGLTNEEMLNGLVAQAASAGIVIDTIGFGNVGESNAEFLKQVSEATGGTYYSAQDTYQLEVSFIRSYYSSLGLEVIDEEASAGANTVSIGEALSNTTAFSIGVVGNGFTPQLKLLCNNTEVDSATYDIQQEGNFTAIQYSNPPEGEYSVSVVDANGGAHLFAVQQKGLVSNRAVAGQQTDYLLIILALLGAVFCIVLIAVVVRSLTKNKPNKEQ